MNFILIYVAFNIEKELFRYFSMLLGFLLLSATLTKGSCQNSNYLLFPAKSSTTKAPPLSVVFIAGLSQKADVQRISGSYHFDSNQQPAAEIGVDYRKGISKGLNLIAGLRVSGTGRNAVFQVPVDKINPSGYSTNRPPEKYNGFDIGLSIPLILEKEWLLKKKNIIFLQGGVNLRKSIMHYFQIYDLYMQNPYGRKVNVTHMELNINNYRKPWLNCNIGGGYGLQLKNQNLLRIGILANYSLSKPVKGIYQINIPDHPLSEGTYGVTGSYIGIVTSYTIKKGIFKTKKKKAAVN